MKNLFSWLALSLALTTLTVAGQDKQDQIQSRPETLDIDYMNKKSAEIMQESQEDISHKEETGFFGPPLPEVTPNGWFDDYDYQSDLDKYLSSKHLDALSAGKNTYVYLYSDWLETCKAFRKSVARKDYAELFVSNQIILLDYNFFKKRFNFKVRQLPIILKVNRNGLLGPESIHPAPNPKDHPKKAYYKLKKFFSLNGEAGTPTE